MGYRACKKKKKWTEWDLSSNLVLLHQLPFLHLYRAEVVGLKAPNNAGITPKISFFKNARTNGRNYDSSNATRNVLP